MTKTTAKAAPRGAAKSTAAPAAAQDTSEAVVAVPASASGVSPEAPGPEAAAEDLARKAEAVLQPGQSIGDVTGGAGAQVLLHVRSTVPRGHRRGGRYWPAEVVTVDAAEFEPADLLAVSQDPRLQVAFEEVGE